MPNAFRWPMVAGLIAWAASTGCSKRQESKPGVWFACTCPYLTDFDDVAKHQLEVCVPEGSRPEQRAQACASQLTHGPSEDCSCSGQRGPCDGKELCRSNEYK
ncbi:MAG: hypothetical protein MUF54_24335 [Polyangiaceae bacterium]|nr:hypothetical protein [Polyangiaceae bacterium]